ncbi:MAG: hypothetical protein MO846_12255 [Candidatus Devosia symbiotica]|nr:hypothetical protein [Candidatus Devosia symbiotica]
MLDITRTNTTAAVIHNEAGHLVVILHFKANMANAGKFDGIRQQIHQNLPQTLFIGAPISRQCVTGCIMLEGLRAKLADVIGLFFAEHSAYQQPWRCRARAARSMTAHSDLQKLLTWLSPAFPMVAFAWSADLESAIASGTMHYRDMTQQWVKGVLIHGSLRTDGILLAQAYRAATDFAELQELADLCLALTPARDQRLADPSAGRSVLVLPLPNRRRRYRRA